MIGLTYILFFAAYAWLAYLVVKRVRKWAVTTNRSSTAWPLAAGVAFFLLLFWDVIPTLLVREYLCRTKPSVVVFKTADQWQREHKTEPKPKQVTEHFSKDSAGRRILRLNDRIGILYEVTNLPFIPLRVSSESLVDLATTELLGKQTAVGAGYSHLRGYSLNALKFWMDLDACIPQGNQWRQTTKDYSDLAL